MNSREMIKSVQDAKQTKTGHYATEQSDGPKSRQKFAAQIAKRFLKSNDLLTLQEFRFIQFVYHCQKYSKQNEIDSVKIRKKK